MLTLALRLALIALAGFILGALLMSLMAAASRADDEAERWWAE